MLQATVLLALAFVAVASAGNCDCCGNDPLPPGCPVNKRSSSGWAMSSVPRRWVADEEANKIAVEAPVQA